MDRVVLIQRVGLAMTFALVVGACSGSRSGSGSGGPVGGHSNIIVAVGSSATGGGGGGGGGGYAVAARSNSYYFTPDPDTVAAGSTVTYQFQDVAHTVIFDTGPTAMTNIASTANADSTRTFTTSGTYTWHCMIHPYMHGTLVVQ